jgi:adenylate cyclase
VDWVAVKGKAEAIRVYELLGLTGQPDMSAEDLAGLADLALTLYQSRDWVGAIRLFEQMLLLRPEDRPASLLLTRCRAYQSQPPPANWDGVHHMQDK